MLVNADTLPIVNSLPMPAHEMWIIVISPLSCEFVWYIFFCSSGFSSEIDEDYEKTRRNIVTKYDRVSFMHNINVYIII